MSKEVMIELSKAAKERDLAQRATRQTFLQKIKRIIRKIINKIKNV